MKANFRIVFFNGSTLEIHVEAKDIDALWQNAVDRTISMSIIQGMSNLILIEIE